MNKDDFSFFDSFDAMLCVTTFDGDFLQINDSFVKVLGYTKEEIVAKLNKWTKKFKEDFGDDTTYRFYENMISAVFTGGEIACEAGIVDLNLDRIYNQVIHEIINIRDNVVRINDVDYESMLGEYINSHQTGILAIEENNRKQLLLVTEQGR